MQSARTQVTKEALSSPFFWLSAFYFVYCARPEDWIPVIGYLPLAKITAICAMIGLMRSAGKTKRTFKDLPVEAKYLLAMIGLLYVSALLSPVWRGGAFFRTIDFSKMFIAWVLTFLLITTIPRLRRIIFIQAGSVVLIAVVSIIKGHSYYRLSGVLGGIYTNPNDLAFAMVLSIPFCLLFMVTTKKVLRKVFWGAGLLWMLAAMFMTASRAGFIDLLISGTVCLWHFGIRGRRFYLIVATVVIGTVLMATAGKTLFDRFAAVESAEGQNAALGSYETRKFLMEKALEGIEHYPILGVGTRNFVSYSTAWAEVHMTYLQIAVEGGIPVLVLYLLFFARGFKNLRILRKRKDLDAETRLFVGALHSSLVGFAVGACFAPEAYQFFPYFAVAYTSVLVAILQEQQQKAGPPAKISAGTTFAEAYANNRVSSELTFVR